MDIGLDGFLKVPGSLKKRYDLGCLLNPFNISSRHFIATNLPFGHLKLWLGKGILPNMAETFRLRIYDKLPDLIEYFDVHGFD